MRVIITGGTGLIGQNLATELKSRGHEIILLSRNPDKAKAPAGVAVKKWDGVSSVGWLDLVDGNTAIVNLAGESIGERRWTDERKALILNSRIHAGQAVTEAITEAHHKPKVLIQASAVGYYGPRHDEEITEDAPAGNDFLAEVCKQWEASSTGVDTVGVRRVVIRIGVVLSLAGGALPRMLTPMWLYIGGPLGSGEQWFPWIHIQDTAQAIRFLIENEKSSGVYNLSAPNPVTNGEFTHHLGKVMQRPAVLPAPGFALKMMLGEMATLVLDGQRVVPHRLLADGFAFTYTEPRPAIQALLKG